MDIHSPELAEQIYQLIQKAKNDPTLKKKLLASPHTVLKSHDILLEDYEVSIEDNPGYGLYFSVKNQDIAHPPIQQITKESSQDSFSEHHFMV